MQFIVRCDCGWQARGSEDTVVEAATEHGRQAHNMTASREQILAMAVPASEAQ
jgi:predicted small metal-binding protein